jgi:uncharacterized protein (TIGR00645 family)
VALIPSHPHKPNDAQGALPSSAKNMASAVERGVEGLLFSSRWLLAPFFVGLALSIFILLIKFAQEVAHIATGMFASTGSQIVAEVLGLVDLTLTASLLIIVVFSGYENFVSRIDHTAHRDWPEWMGSIDFTGLKLKLMSSIVAISAVQLLRLFLALGTTADRELYWSMGIHMVFVVSSVLLALSDRLSNSSHAKPPSVPAPAAPADQSPTT